MLLKQYFKPMEKQCCEVEYGTFVAYILGTLSGIAILYRSMILSRLMGERAVDILGCLVVITLVIILKAFRTNINHPVLSQYAYISTSILYADILLQGDKYVVGLALIVWLYVLQAKEQRNIEEILKELLCTIVIVEADGIYYLLTVRMETNGWLDRFILGFGIDIALLVAVLIWMLKDRIESILMRMFWNKNFQRMTQIATFIGLICWSLWMIQGVQFPYWAQLIQEHHRTAMILAVLLLICVLKPWEKTLQKTSCVRKWNLYPERISIILGILCVGLGLLTPYAVNTYAMKSGYTSCYSVEDIWNGNIVLDGFDLTDNGILVANRADAWILIRRKPGFDRKINNVSFRLEQFSGGEENASYFVFVNEDNWGEGYEAGSFVSKKGKILIDDDAMHHIQNYIRLDLTEKKGTRIKLSEIRINDYRGCMGGIRYLGYLLIVIGGVLFVEKSLQEKKTANLKAVDDVAEYGGQHGENENK